VLSRLPVSSRASGDRWWAESASAHATPCQPRDQPAVALIGLIPGQVLLLPRHVRDQRLHAHQRQPARLAQVLKRHPPRPRRLARHAQPGIPHCPRLLQRPVQVRTQVMYAHPRERRASTCPSAPGHRQRLLLLTQIQPRHKRTIKNKVPPGLRPITTPGRDPRRARRPVRFATSCSTTMTVTASRTNASSSSTVASPRRPDSRVRGCPAACSHGAAGMENRWSRPEAGGLRASQTVGDNDHLAMRLAINRAEWR
jgi:hypothetical protein